jgi:broad specificity phosphatase PhoE
MEHYRVKLRYFRKQRPDLFRWPDEAFDDVVERMRAAFEKGAPHYNKNSTTIRAMCAELGLSCTYAAIDAFIRSEK